jgi:hypothetical protein
LIFPPSLKRTRLIWPGGSKTSEEVLHLLAKERSFKIQEAVSSNWNTGAKTLEYLSNSKSPIIRRIVAHHRNTPLKTLIRLIKDEDFDVVRNAVKNSKITCDIIRSLVDDSRSSVRFGMASNKNTPSDILDKLSSDPKIIYYVAKHPNTSAKTLDCLCGGDYDWLIVENSNTSSMTLARIASNPSTPFDILIRVPEHPNAPKEIKQKIEASKMMNKDMEKCKRKLRGANLETKLRIYDKFYEFINFLNSELDNQ